MVTFLYFSIIIFSNGFSDDHIFMLTLLFIYQIYISLEIYQIYVIWNKFIH